MSQEGKPDFYTQKGYQMRSQHALTGAMEDYLEMICRQAEADGCARIGLLAEGLNVRPSSASKMVYQLRALGLVAFEKYGLIQPTEKGRSVGRCSTGTRCSTAFSVCSTAPRTSWSWWSRWSTI